MTAVESNSSDSLERLIQRKQSDLDSGLELDEKSNTDFNSKLFLLTAENAKLLNMVERLRNENQRLKEDLENKTRMLRTENLVMSTLSLMLKQREASYQALSEKYETFCDLVGNMTPDSWTLNLIKRLIEKVEGEPSDEPTEEVCRLKSLVDLLEDSLCKMDHSLQQESEWRREMEDKMKKLHLELHSIMSINHDLRNKVYWYEVKTCSLEKSLQKHVRNSGLLKVRLNDLQDRYDELTQQIEDLKKKPSRKHSSHSATSSVHDSKTSMVRIPENEYAELKTMLGEQENKLKILKSQLESLNEDYLSATRKNSELEMKVKNMDILRKRFIKLAIKHKHSSESANENLLKLKEIISQLKSFLKLSGVDFVDRTEESKWVLSVGLGVGANRRQIRLQEILSDKVSEISDAQFDASSDKAQVVQFEKVVSGEQSSTESIPEEIEWDGNEEIEESLEVKDKMFISQNILIDNEKS